MYDNAKLAATVVQTLYKIIFTIMSCIKFTLWQKTQLHGI